MKQWRGACTRVVGRFRSGAGPVHECVGRRGEVELGCRSLPTPPGQRQHRLPSIGDTAPSWCCIGRLQPCAGRQQQDDDCSCTRRSYRHRYAACLVIAVRRHPGRRRPATSARSRRTAASSRSTRTPRTWCRATRNGTADVFVHDRQTGTTAGERRDRRRPGRTAISNCAGDLSADGRLRRVLARAPATWCRATRTAPTTCSCTTGRRARPPG